MNFLKSHKIFKKCLFKIKMIIFLKLQRIYKIIKIYAISLFLIFKLSIVQKMSRKTLHSILFSFIMLENLIKFIK